MTDSESERMARQDLPPDLTDPGDAAAAAELAEAERQVSQGGGTPEQVAGAAAARRARTESDRIQAWRRTTGR
ncbi:hypothetical protein SAMN05216207_105812 [Pseudonocardia ammonioxydans]|uniref:Uncharacterized protein n=1 Tax=Pseudonocardia ammonioxydans TaxID=260086 RepID=A0A1I5H6I1_PSUAM|nr:hypothetical protein [Pseudonocardia ammonioxydans]SFO43700.1 hypothetical protein SAMN05216207_105812 [Pseudonocardia ammonioxydans]